MLRRRPGRDSLFYVTGFIFIAIFMAIYGPSSAWAEPRNVIILIGDGMGFEHVRAAGMYENGADGNYVFEGFPYQGQVTTYSANSSITDSAAAATAIATGQKVNNDVISVKLPGNGSALYTILEHCRDNNKSTGLVTVTPMTHATPAAFGAHESSRNNTSQIAQDYLSQTRPNVLFGAGGNGMTTSAASSAGYTVVTNRTAMMNLNTETATMVSGQFGTNFPYEYNGYSTSFPHLSEMTASALEVLDNDPQGFFLMVEGGLIDWAAHDNNLAYTVFEVMEFNSVVEVVLDWAQGQTDTLVLVTADHETGGLTVLQNNGQGSLPSVTWSTQGHTADNVPVYALGENAQLFTGTMDNTEFFGKITTAMSNLVDYYCDNDLDGYVASSVSGSCNGTGCQPLDCEVLAGTDCDDTDNAVYPGSAEVIADGTDQDCNGEDRCYEDLDNDSYGSSIEKDDTDGDLSCSTGLNVSGNNTDCDDSDGQEYPGQIWYEDVDGDLYSSGNMHVQCVRPANCKAASELTAADGDCDDTDNAVYPGSAEVIADGTDQDCNGEDRCYEDLDNDSYGSSIEKDDTDGDLNCSTGLNVSGYNTDCDDTDPNIYPGGPDVRIAGAPPVYYSTVQGAYDNAAADDIIEIRDAVIVEDLVFNVNRSVSIKAGYDCSYSTLSGRTAINGDLIISDGELIIQDGTLEGL